jgi:hypothetical protein
MQERRIRLETPPPPVRSVDIQQLSGEQKLAVDLLLDHYEKMRSHLQDTALLIDNVQHVVTCEKPEPLYLQVYGLGGTGKSFVLRGFLQILEARYPGSSACVKVSAQSGVAAKGCGGATNHRTFGLIVSEVDADELGVLDNDDEIREGDSLMRLQLDHKGVEYYFIDEYGTLGAASLGEIGSQVNKIHCTPDGHHLGDKSFFFFWHHAQLPLVRDKRQYCKDFMTEKSYKKLSRKAKYGSTLWNYIMPLGKFVILRKQKRRHGYDKDTMRPERFLNNAMNGTNDYEDWQFVNENGIKSKPHVLLEENEAWHLCARRADVDDGNMTYVQSLSNKVVSRSVRGGLKLSIKQTLELISFTNKHNQTFCRTTGFSAECECRVRHDQRWA